VKVDVLQAADRPSGRLPEWAMMLLEYRWNRLAVLLSVLLAVAAVRPAVAEWPACGTVEAWPADDPLWPRPDLEPPEGWDQGGLAATAERFSTLESAALVILHRGRIVLALGSVAERYTGQSLRKPLVGALVGLAVDEGRLSLETTLEDLGLGTDDPPLLPGQATATVEHLLASRSGIMHSALYEVGYWKRRRAALLARDEAAGRALSPPGTFWIYNNWDFNALGTIVELAREASIGRQLARDIARPIGMQDFRPVDVTYIDRDEESERQLDNRSNHRAYMVDISTRDLARFGLLYLNCGRWQDREVVPRDWVLASLDGRPTSSGSAESESGDWGRYGYLWWDDSGPTRTYPALDGIAGMAFAHGYRGHFLAIVPALDLVVAHQVATVGGIGTAAQLRRLRDGSPEVTDHELDALLGLIVASHPSRRS
jgi:CubicO group peptidase (beta-lactamase class C family)